MSKCGFTFCNNEVEQTPGKKARKYCSNTCRQKQWQIDQKKQEEAGQGIAQQIPVIDQKRQLDLEKENTQLRKENADLKKQVAELIPYRTSYQLRQKEEVSKTSTTAQEEVKIPKTYEELKAMCPPELKGMEKTFWLAEYREKYGV